MKLVMNTQAKITADTQMSCQTPSLASVVGEANRQQAPDADHAVYRDGTDRVVDLQLVDVDDRANDQAADQRRSALQPSASASAVRP